MRPKPLGFFMAMCYNWYTAWTKIANTAYLAVYREFPLFAPSAQLLLCKSARKIPAWAA